MTALVDTIDTHYVEMIYAAANTPVFLAMRIRRDQASLVLARRESGESIFSALEQSVSKSPENLRDRVTPYVLLGALAAQNRVDLIARAATLQSGDPWFVTVVSILRAAIMPSSVQVNAQVAVPGLLPGPSTLHSPLKNNTQKITLPA